MLVQNKGSNLPTKIALIAIALAAVLYLKNCVKSGAIQTEDGATVDPAAMPEEPAAEVPSLPDGQEAPSEPSTETPSETPAP